MLYQTSGRFEVRVEACGGCNQKGPGADALGPWAFSGLAKGDGLRRRPLERLVNVVQRPRLEIRNLRENQIKKTVKTAHWQIGRPFLGHGDRRFLKDSSEAAGHDTAAGKNQNRPDRVEASLFKEPMRGLQEGEPDS
jgi:hypothetical protein